MPPVVRLHRHPSSQSGEGYWTGSHVGPMLATTMYFTILQLDNNTLPIYQR